MTDELKEPLTEAALDARSIARWENEGGAKKNPKRLPGSEPAGKLIVDVAAAGEEDEARGRRGACALRSAFKLTH